jgi:enamine deaminase RidA (YjgF/YER057c/UK114 family)
VSHQFLNPDGLGPPVGFSHVALPAPGRLVLLAGQTAHRADGTLAGDTMTEQFEAAAANVVAALAAGGARPQDLVWLQIFVVDVDAYRDALGPIGAAWRARFGAHYPPMALFGVSRLFDPDALVELMAIAVIPEG